METDSMLVSDHSGVKLRKGGGEGKRRQSLLSCCTHWVWQQSTADPFPHWSVHGLSGICSITDNLSPVFPKLIQKKLYSGYSVTLTTTHIIQIAETDSCRQHFTQDDSQRLTLVPYLPAVHEYPSMHHSLPKPKGLPCSSY